MKIDAERDTDRYRQKNIQDRRRKKRSEATRRREEERRVEMRGAKTTHLNATQHNTNTLTRHPRQAKQAFFYLLVVFCREEISNPRKETLSQEHCQPNSLSQFLLSSWQWGDGTAAIFPVGQKGRWLPHTPSGCLEVDLRAALAHFRLGRSVQR